jgi:hydroxymethylpyrimidine/phosphomethylpyrimidine kinase
MEVNMKTTLTIAGSDSCGGAGIQADIKTMTAYGVYAMSAVTALTAQNTTGVADIMEVAPEFLGRQLDSIFTDIYPDAVKIGMVSSADLIETISERLKFYRAKNIVLDPVMISTSGSKLLRDDAVTALKKYLLRQAVLLTPNIPEASVLSGIPVVNEEDMIKAAEIISGEYGCAVLCKGGHSVNDASDLLYRSNGYSWFIGERIDNLNTHGTGCTLSSAIASGLAKDMDLETSIRLAKEYVTGALKAMLDLGKGNGPLNHMWNICGEENRTWRKN